MNKIALILSLSLLGSLIRAQQNDIPEVKLTNLEGQAVSSLDVFTSDEATIIVFWDPNNGRCCDNLDEMNDAWVENLKNSGVRLIAICVNCNGNWTQVKPIINGNGWEFETYIDLNGDFKRAMCVGEVPYAMLYDDDQNLVSRYVDAAASDQQYICENIKDRLDMPETVMNMTSGK